MDIVKAENLPRKWEWIAKQLKRHEGTEKLVEISEKIDAIMKEIYGEHTHTSHWVIDMETWEHDFQLTTITDMATRNKNCTACFFSRKAELKGGNVCEPCEFAKKAGECGEPDDSDLFSQFVIELLNYQESLKK